MQIEQFLESKAGVLSLGLSIALSLGPLAISAWLHLKQRKAELRFKNIELYHDLIRSLVETDAPSGEMRLTRQMAAVYELRNFPDYRAVSARILSNLLETWPEKPHLKSLRGEIRGTIEFLNSKLKRPERVALPPVREGAA